MKKKVFLLLFIFLSFFSKGLFAKEDRVLSEEEVLNRIESHIFLEDFSSALLEAKEAIDLFPDSKEVKKIYLKTLSESDYLKALSLSKKYFSLEELKEEKDLLEKLSWNVIKKGLNSFNYSNKLASLIGLYFTKMARAVFLLKETMRNQNAILRTVAIQLACSYQDEILKDELFSLLKEEKVWFVRIEILKAIGKMKIKKSLPCLKAILKDSSTNFEEKFFAVEAICSIYENISEKELRDLLSSPHQGFRMLGCELASYFKIKEVKEDILNLVNDHIVEVKISSLNAILLFYKDIIEKRKLEKVLKKTYLDFNPYVAITSAILGYVIKDKEAEEFLKKWVFDKYPENRRFASSAIAYLGFSGKNLFLHILEKTKDPYVKANIALALVGQRMKLKECADIFFELSKNKNEMWMWDNSENFLFTSLAPSRIRYIDQLPNYPEAMDQKTQLDILSILAILKDKRAKESIEKFLKEKTWGITGLAAITLLREGDDDSIKLMKTLLSTPNKNVKVQAALVLAMVGKDRDVIPILEKFYFEVDRNLKLTILEAIGNTKDKNVIPFLLKALEDPFLIVKIKAAASLLQIINS